MTYSRSEHPAVTLSVRVSPKMRKQLEELSNATGRTKSFLASEAIKSYLGAQAWQVDSTRKSLKKANSKKANFIDHYKVIDWVNSWEEENEQEMPK